MHKKVTPTAIQLSVHGQIHAEEPSSESLIPSEKISALVEYPPLRIISGAMKYCVPAKDFASD